ncbi:SRPBCC family protein, partial [Spirochaeta dissipatitropha]
MSVLLFSMVILGGCDLFDFLTSVDVSFYDLTANGISGTQTTSELTLGFDESPATLESSHITITGANKDSVDLSDLVSGTVKVKISGLTVADGESVTVELTNPSGYRIQPGRRSVMVHRAAASESDGDGDG